MISNLDELKFIDGYSIPETVEKLYDQLALQCAAHACLDFLPVASKQALVDALTPVSEAYEHKHLFRFTVSIEKVHIDFGGGMDLSTEKKVEFKLTIN